MIDWNSIESGLLKDGIKFAAGAVLVHLWSYIKKSNLFRFLQRLKKRLKLYNSYKHIKKTFSVCVNAHFKKISNVLQWSTQSKKGLSVSELETRLKKTSVLRKYRTNILFPNMSSSPFVNAILHNIFKKISDSYFNTILIGSSKRNLSYGKITVLKKPLNSGYIHYSVA